MQQVLGFSAIETGVAYLPLTLTIVLLANVAQNLVTRVGVRRVMPVGLALAAGALSCSRRCRRTATTSSTSSPRSCSPPSASPSRSCR